MTKKTNIIIVVILILIVVIGYAASQGLFGHSYKYNGTLAECISDNKTTYQYVSNNTSALPKHFSITGEPIACDFNGRTPNPTCQQFLSTLKFCKVIYRTDKIGNGLKGVYEPEATQALKVLEGKI